MEDGVTFRSLEEARTTVARLLAVTRASYERRAQLEYALESRVTIEQAKGILSERLGISVEEAFDVLRRAARSHRRKLHAVAAEVIASRETPPVVASVLERRRAQQV